ncbi:MAG TPA: acyl-CoA dehydrogenase family protein [Streptosporangiaceae bacterium]|nr:acyl-CoA dehydrogenase family protein [Streptosporangiaceae bacterium]
MSTSTPARPATAGLPNLLPGETQEDLRSAVHDLLADRCDWRSVLARMETAQSYDTDTWRVLAADVGCAGLLVPEAHGGAGASYREMAVVAEEAGRFVAPVPYLGSAVVATAALLASGGDDPLVPRLASGDITAALAVPFAARPPVPDSGADVSLGSDSSLFGSVRVTAAPPGDPSASATLRGTVPGVVDALPAGILLVPTDGVPAGLYAVEAGAPGVTMAPVVSLDATRQLCDLTLDNVPARLVASGEAATLAVRSALTAGCAMLASEQLGMSQRCLEMTITYLKERYQFARPVGSFQALKHRLADLWVAITQARAAGAYATACLADADPDTAVAVALAKAACGDVAVLAAQECVQLHGGIGFTWDHPAHLYLKRAKTTSIAFGTPDWHRWSLAGMVGLPR